MHENEEIWILGGVPGAPLLLDPPMTIVQIELRCKTVKPSLILIIYKQLSSYFKQMFSICEKYQLYVSYQKLWNLDCTRHLHLQNATMNKERGVKIWNSLKKSNINLLIKYLCPIYFSISRARISRVFFANVHVR